ncbi:MAG: hypothetical protein AAF581_07490 [Planctomycetota bacterium]
MRNTLHLAMRYLRYSRGRTAILISCVALVTYLPIAVELLIRHFERELTARADATPLIVGAKGSRFDLLLNALYFHGRTPEPILFREASQIQASGLATPIPILLGNTAKSYPIVGTSLEYFSFRRLDVASGTLPQLLGDVVVGASLAAELGLQAGGRLRSDGEKLYDISAAYPLNMRCTGVLAETGTSDDWAAFVGMRTAWLLAGIGHGHQDLSAAESPTLVLERSDEHVQSSAAVREYQEVTAENIDGFHFHGNRDEYPVTAVLALPRDAKSATILRARLAKSETVQWLLPGKELGEFLRFAFQVKRFFDANLVLVLTATALFLALIVLLSIRVRERELLTYYRIGCSRFTVVKLQGTELALVIVAGAGIATALAGATLLVVGQLARV